ncbi:helix-turn-helix domain-containing protein [Streptomyces pseudovenezuelae]|uniref:helix-turn-helix domain-containing protein n=1 Tax=Streptomyces pseudovenezuelae TaxID=67350 RepID=UPI002E2F7250|nr:helix-turn-helix domain-containing protein [Streptomyces pseudovenezuelae]
MTFPAPHAALTGALREETARKAAELYLAGCTIESTARQIHRSYGATRTLLLEAGVKLRAPGGARTRSQPSTR